MDQIRKRKTKYIVPRTPSDEVIDQVEKGSRFIVVEDDMDDVPDGYMLLNMEYKGESFKALVPKRLVFYLANPGEGEDVDGALDDVSDFYGEAEKYEDNVMEGGGTNVQEAHLTTIAREAYKTYVVNKLTKDGRDFDDTVLEDLLLKDDYIEKRAKAMAAVCLGKTVEELKASDLKDVVKHVTIREKRTEKLTREEFKQITCWAGSHYEIKDEYRHNSDVSYDIDRRHDRGHTVGIKTVHKIEVEVFDEKIRNLEKDIMDYWKRQGRPIKRHDSAILRQYVNIKYIAKENKDAQLDIAPPPGLDDKEVKRLMDEAFGKEKRNE